MTIISTLNRTPQSYLVAILGAEQVTGIIPSGTHDWNKFLTPGRPGSLVPMVLNALLRAGSPCACLPSDNTLP